MDVGQAGPGQRHHREEFEIAQRRHDAQRRRVPIQRGERQQDPALGRIRAALPRQFFAPEPPRFRQQRDFHLFGKRGHRRRKRQLQQLLRLPVAVREHADDRPPARIARGERFVDPIPREITDGDRRHAGLRGSFERNGRDVHHDQVGALPAQHFRFVVDQLFPFDPQFQRFVQRRGHVHADGILLHHADVERAGPDAQAAIDERQAAAQKAFRQVGRHGHLQGRMGRQQSAEDVARAHAVAVAVGGDVVGDVALFHDVPGMLPLPRGREKAGIRRAPGGRRASSSASCRAPPSPDCA